MKKLILFSFASVLAFILNSQTSIQDPGGLDDQIVELFRAAQLAGCILEHDTQDILIVEIVNLDTFYTKILHRNRIIYLDIRSTAGLWRREIRVGNVFVFWYPKEFIGGLILQYRVKWDFYDLNGINSKKPVLKLSKTDVSSLYRSLGEINEYIFSKK